MQAAVELHWDVAGEYELLCESFCVSTDISPSMTPESPVDYGESVNPCQDEELLFGTIEPVSVP